MVRKNKDDNNTYQKNYYHTKNLKKVQSDRARLNYWRKKYMVKFNCYLNDCKNLTEYQLRDEINTEMCSI
jgi:hypothetical protein